MINYNNIKKYLPDLTGSGISGQTVYSWLVFFVIIIFISIYNHLISHVIIAGYSIALVYMLFIFTSRSCSFKGKSYIVNVVNALMVIALLDFFHIFTFKGMALIDFYGSNVSIQFWIGAGILEAAVFLLFLVIPAGMFSLNSIRFILSAIVLAVIVSIIVYKNFPVCYIDNYGPTGFKFSSQMLIIFLLISAIFCLKREKEKFENLLFISIVAALLLSIACETIMVLFDENIFLAGTVAHFLKALSCYLICNSVYTVGISRPVEKYFGSEQIMKSEWAKIRKLFKTFNYTFCSINTLTGAVRLKEGWLSNEANETDRSGDNAILWGKMVHPEDIHIINRLKGREDSGVNYDLRVNAGSGNYEWVNLRGIATEGGPSEELNEIFCILTHISEMKKAELELLEQKRKIEESDRLKSAFIDNLGHEIRTPLDSILGFSRMLREHGRNPDKSGLYIDIIESSSRQILSVVSDLIDIARIDEGQFQLNYDSVDLNCLIDEMEELYRLRLKTANKGHIGFRTSKGADGVCEIVSDRARLKQVLFNLLNNAIKFTHTGEITLGYEISGDNVIFRVTDTGIGINEDKKEIILDRFRQGDEGVSRTYGGLGLGLPIVRELIHLMGGTFGFVSEPGIGSQFYFTIPLNNKGGTV